MRETAHVALLIVLVLVGIAPVATGADQDAPAKGATTDAGVPDDSGSWKQARERLSDLLFSDAIERIDFQATTYEVGASLINTTADKILDIGVPILGDADAAADKGVEVIEALNASKARGLYATIQKEKQSLVIRNRGDAGTLGEVVGTTISIIRDHYGASAVSYRDKAASLFRTVRVDPEETIPLLERYLETVQHVAGLSPNERAKYLN
jgi:hypothetical protein